VTLTVFHFQTRTRGTGNSQCKRVEAKTGVLHVDYRDVVQLEWLQGTSRWDTPTWLQGSMGGVQSSLLDGCQAFSLPER
jgi:hypothetical protein